MAGLLIACQGAPRPADLTRTGARIGSALTGVLDDPAQSVFLASLSATSGSGVERVVDGDLKTGWAPTGDPNDESIAFEVPTPLAVRVLTVAACADSSEFKLQTYLNGVSGPVFSLSPGEPHDQELGDEQSRQGLVSLALRVELAGGTGAPPCIAEIGMTGEKGPLRLRPPRWVRGQLRASSTAEPLAIWSASRLADGHLDTGWAEGTSGLGEGERILVTLDESVEITGLHLWNGDQRSASHFRDHGRVARLRVEFDEGEPIVADVGDEYGKPVTVAFTTPRTVKGFALVLDAGVEGRSYRDGKTVVLSQLTLEDRHGALLIRTRDAYEREQAVRSAIRGRPLEAFVDTQWSSVCGYPRREIKVRSDQSFIRYDANARWDVSDELGVNEVFEGHWYTVGEQGPWSRLELWGTRRRADTRWQPEAVPETVRGAEGDLEIASVKALGQDGFRAIVEDWGRRAEADRVDCLTEELGAWPDLYTGLVEANAIVLRGGVIQDLLWKESR